MSPNDNTATAASTQPTMADINMLWSFIRFNEKKHEVDWVGVAEACGLKNDEVARTRFGQIRKKLGLPGKPGSGREPIPGAGPATAAADATIVGPIAPAPAPAPAPAAATTSRPAKRKAARPAAASPSSPDEASPPPVKKKRATRAHLPATPTSGPLARGPLVSRARRPTPVDGIVPGDQASQQ